MRPVMQTTFGNPRGNCLIACVASIMDQPLEAWEPVHEAMQAAADAGESWWEPLLAAVRGRGWGLLYLGEDEGWSPRGLAPPGWSIAAGESPRRGGDDSHPGHCVVFRDGVLAHDPHPDCDGLVGLPDHFYLLIPPAGETAPREEP